MARFKSRKERVHHALRMYHGIGCKEHDREEIAEFLDVRPTLVEEYIYDTDMAAYIDQTKNRVAEITRDEIIAEKRDRLATLREMEEQLMDAVEVVVTDFSFEEVELEVTDTDAETLSVPETSEATYQGEVPVPSEVKQVPQFRRLREVWQEMRQVEEDLTRLQGLAEPEQVDVTGELTERKLYKLGDDAEDAFPEQEVSNLDEQDSV